MESSKLGLVWYKDQFRFFKEYKPIKNSTKLKIKIRDKWVKISDEDITRMPEEIEEKPNEEKEMPYIKPEKRKAFDPYLEKIAESLIDKGDLNYCFFKIGQLVINKIGESYDNLSQINGAMSDCAMEWYRSRVVPYEDKKIKENGDIT